MINATEQELLAGGHTPRHELPTLLFSMDEFLSVISPILFACKPKLLMEIGVEAGKFCETLLSICKSLDARYIGVDPTLDRHAIDKIEAAGGEICGEMSIVALQHLPLADAYFVDGDHNYYTVLNELNLILEKAQETKADRHAPVIFLHDTGWPCGRRDFYYNLEAIPPECRQPSVYGAAIQPGNDGISDQGYMVFGTHAASKEGGEKNGVLTAIEDVLSRNPDWRLLNVPAVFGLGIVFNPERMNADLKAVLNSLAGGLQTLGPILSTLEKNRTILFDHLLRHIQLQKRVFHPDLVPQSPMPPNVSWLKLHERKWRAIKFVAKSFAALRPGCHPGRLKAYDLARAYWSGRSTLGAKVASRPVACFDMFDTLVRRVCDPPEIVLRDSMGFAWLLLARNGIVREREAVINAREAATFNLRRKMEAAGVDPECNLREILKETLQELSCPEELAGDLAKMIESYEIACEIRKIQPMPGAKDLLQACKAAGQTTVVASDIYMSGEQLSEILAAKGLLPYIDHVFSSADHRCGKYSGGLFKVISKQLGVDFDAISHLGDNIHSDYLAPKRLGIQGMWYLNFRELSRRELLYVNGLRLGFSSLAASPAPRPKEKSRDERSLHEIGYQIYGPMFLSFLTHVAEKSVQLGLKDVYFLARDGYGFFDLFEQLWKSMPTLQRFPMPNVHYLYLSRTSSNVILASELSTRGAEIALLKNPYMRVGEFLKFCDLDLDEAEDPEQFGVDRQSALKAALGTPAFDAWTTALATNIALRKKADHERWKLQEYLTQNNFFSAGPKAFVDVGWNGTIPHLLNQQFHGHSGFPDLHVILLGRCKSIFGSSSQVRYTIHPGFLMDDNGFPFNGRIPMDVPPLIELAANAPYGSTVGYEVATSGKIKPILEATQASELKFGSAIREGWMEFIRDHMEFEGAYIHHERLRATAANKFLKLYLQPPRRFVRAIAKCVFCLDWKTEGKFDLVGARHGWRFYHRYLTGVISPVTWAFGAAKRYWVPRLVVRIVTSLQRSI